MPSASILFTNNEQIHNLIAEKKVIFKLKYYVLIDIRKV